MRFPCSKIYCKMGIWWRKSTHTLGGKMGTNFPGSSNSMDFIAFCHAMGNWWRNPRISHITKDTIGCESDGKKLTILSEKYVYQFPRFTIYDGFYRIFPGANFPGFSHLMGFPAFFHAMGNWWENLWISHLMKYTTRWEPNGKNHPFYGKRKETNFSDLSILMGFADFPNAMGNVIRKPMHFPCDEVYHRMRI